MIVENNVEYNYDGSIKTDASESLRSDDQNAWKCVNFIIIQVIKKRPSCMLGHTDITRRTVSEIYLASEREFEEEVENCIGYT